MRLRRSLPPPEVERVAPTEPGLHRRVLRFPTLARERPASRAFHARQRDRVPPAQHPKPPKEIES